MPTPQRLVPLVCTLALATGATLLSTAADAALVARSLDGNASTAEAYYDTVLGITWLRDTQALSGAYGAGQTMNYAATTSALSAFNADSALNFGFGTWRLPTANGVHTIGGAGCQSGFSGSTDCGENVDTASSELASMFHDTLGNLSWRDTSGNLRSGGQGVGWGLADTADFINLLGAPYWSSTSSFRLIFNVPQTGQVTFQMVNGSQGITPTTGSAYAWLVHDGDIGQALTTQGGGSVPLPGTLALAGLGLWVLAGQRRARR